MKEKINMTSSLNNLQGGNSKKNIKRISLRKEDAEDRYNFSVRDISQHILQDQSVDQELQHVNLNGGFQHLELFKSPPGGVQTGSQGDQSPFESSECVPSQQAVPADSLPLSLPALREDQKHLGSGDRQTSARDCPP